MISSIINWIEQYGPESIGVLAILVGLFVLYEQYVKYFFEKRLKSKNRSQYKEEREHLDRRKADLPEQEFFSNILFKLTVEIPSENFSEDAVKSELFRDIMRQLLGSYHSYMIEFVSEIDVEWDRATWNSRLNDKHYKIVENFKVNALESGVPALAIKRFMVWYTPYMQQIFFYVKKVSAMHNKNSIENTRTFLLLLELILMNALTDIVKSPVINGDLDGIEYKGNVIGADDK